MKNNNIGFNELQEGTKISKSTLSPLVNSDEIPSKTKIETLERVADFLGVSILTLLDKNIKTFSDFQFMEKESDLKSRIICYSYEKHKLFFELETQSYEVNGKLEYYLFLVLNDYPDTLLNTILSVIENSSYNDVSEFLELSLNRLKIQLPKLNSSLISVELQITLKNGITISAQRVGMYTKEHSFFNLPRKDGTSFKTERVVYDF